MEAHSTLEKALDGLQTAEPGLVSSGDPNLEGVLVIASADNKKCIIPQ